MGLTNRQIIKAAASGTITTGSVTAGLLSSEQSKKFVAEAVEQQKLLPLVRHEMRHARTGEIDKIGIAKRIMRKKTENVDDNYRAAPTFGSVSYSTTAARIPWEISEETFRENIEGQGFEATVTKLMSEAWGADMEDLGINGDTSTSVSAEDYNFLKLNDGWLKQMIASGHVEDRASKSSGAMSIDVFFDTLKRLPNKYNNTKLKWLMSPHRFQEWNRYLLDKLITAGGGITDGIITSPAAIGAVEIPSWPDGKIALCDPKNLILINTYGVVIRKTAEGVEAVLQDKRFYTIHNDMDFIIEETDAVAVATNLAAI